MSGQDRRHRLTPPRHSEPSAKRIFGPMVAGGAAAYVRTRDLPKLLALWPHEIEDRTEQEALRILARLRRALRTERRRALAAHWSYDLNRHLGLLSAYKGELADLRLGRAAAQPNCTRRESGRGSRGTRG